VRPLRLDAVPVVRPALVPPEQMRAYRIADSELALDAGEALSSITASS
jgi:hypothetical protein